MKAVLLALYVCLLGLGPACNLPPDELLVTPIPTPTQPPTDYLSIRVTNVRGQVGDTVKANVLVTGADLGVSGFQVFVEVSDDAVAQIVDVELEPIGFAVVGDLPATSVEVILADLVRALDGPIGWVDVAIVDVELLSEGWAILSVDVVEMDDGKGGKMYPWVYPGIINVTAAEVRP